MTKREPLLSELYFDDHIAFVEQAIAEYEEAVGLDATQFTDLAGVYYTVCQYRLSLFISCYSRGYPVAELRQQLHALIETWEKQRQLDTNSLYTSDYKTDISSYQQAFWALAWAYLTGLEQAAVLRLLACLGPSGQDLLLEQLVAKIAPGTVRQSAKKLLYPKAYQPLYAATEAAADQQPPLLHSFLQQWYGKMRNTDWHNAHLGPDGGGFDGYWCWEAAAIAVAYGIDDQRFRDLAYYPQDLADFARTHLPA